MTGLESDAADLPPRRPKVPPFARYEGTSAWRKDRRKVRAYARFRAAETQKQVARDAQAK